MKQIYTVYRASVFLGIGISEMNQLIIDKDIIHTIKNGKFFIKHDYLAWYKKTNKH